MKRVVLESPYSSANGRDIQENIVYAKECIKDCLRRGESPIASHLLFTQPGILDDLKPEERKLGISAGHAWYEVADTCVIYADHGITSGMQQGIDAAMANKIPTQVRYLGVSSSAVSLYDVSSFLSAFAPKVSVVRRSDS